MKTKCLLAPAILILAGFSPVASTVSAQIVAVTPASLTGTGLVTFDDIAGGGGNGVNYDTTFESNGASFGERFVGQTLTLLGDNDKLSGAPSGGSLTLAVGAPGQNLNVFFYTTSQVMDGLGFRGFPTAEAVGEGSFAVLFDFDQSQFGFDLVGGNGGNATIDFFRRDGGLIQSIVVSGLSDQSYAFARVGGVHDIAGISIWNDDAGGIGFDNLRHDVPGVVGPPPPTGAVPEPGTYGALGALLMTVLVARKLKRGRSA
jgi:hypothetical protein